MPFCILNFLRIVVLPFLYGCILATLISFYPMDCLVEYHGVILELIISYGFPSRFVVFRPEFQQDFVLRYIVNFLLLFLCHTCHN